MWSEVIALSKLPGITDLGQGWCVTLALFSLVHAVVVHIQLTHSEHALYGCVRCPCTCVLASGCLHMVIEQHARIPTCTSTYAVVLTPLSCLRP